MIQIKRVYDDPKPTDGTTFLVDRVWPRGITRERLTSTIWLKEVAPSAALRRWFGHDAAKWEEFQRRYGAELDRQAEAWQPIVSAARRGPVTLLYSARDPQHNNAVALRAYIETVLQRSTEPGC